jgi:hypothetical protein
MILLGSALLLAIGLLILLVQALRIAFSLLKIAYYLIKGAVYLAVLVVCGVCLSVQYVMRWLKPEPVVNFYSDDDASHDADVPTIELPRTHFHRL